MFFFIFLSSEVPQQSSCWEQCVSVRRVASAVAGRCCEEKTRSLGPFGLVSGSQVRAEASFSLPPAGDDVPASLAQHHQFLNATCGDQMVIGHGPAAQHRSQKDCIYIIRMQHHSTISFKRMSQCVWVAVVWGMILGS